MDTVQIELKYTFHCKPKELFLFLHNPQFLKSWIAEDVELDKKTGVYTFYWGEHSESAKIIEKDQRRRFLKWEWIGGDHKEYEYVSFRVGEADEADWVDLFIEDFCEEDAQDSLREDWDQQIHRLKRAIGGE